MITHTLNIESNVLESKNFTKNIIEFCGTISTKITFAAHLSYYNLSAQEYLIACKDFSDYYNREDENRRNKFMNNIEYRKTLLSNYHTVEEVSEYFNRLHRYDLVEYDEVKKTLNEYMNNSIITKTIARRRQEKNMLAKKEEKLPKESFIGSNFTFISHCTIGGDLYKVYNFKVNNSMIIFLLNKGDLLDFFSFEDIELLEDPAFYADDNLVLSICTHERTITLHLTEEQYKSFKSLGIPHVKN